MTTGEGVFRRHAARLVALAIILGLYGLARQPELSGTEQARLAGRFQLRSPARCPSSPATCRGPSARSIPA